MAKFKVGHVVELKSGSDPMTVIAVTEGAEGKQATITCRWFPVVAQLDIKGSTAPVYDPLAREQNYPADALARTVKEKVEED